MNAEEINVKIAELCGWNVPDGCISKRTMRGEKGKMIAGAPTDFGKSPDGIWHDSIPNYYASLDACAQFEATLTEKQRLTYANNLTNLCGNWLGAISATAPQRCSAFLAVKGITPPASGV